MTGLEAGVAKYRMDRQLGRTESVQVIGDQVLLFHYVATDDIAKSIARSGLMYPSGEDFEDQGWMVNEQYAKPRVNFTAARPEEGRRAVAVATGGFIPEDEINYGLELLVPLELVERYFEHQPRNWQAFTEEPVPIRVLRIWKMDKVEQRTRSGWDICRKLIGNSPIARYERPIVEHGSSSLQKTVAQELTA